MESGKYIPDGEWVPFILPWVEGREIPISRIRPDGNKWITEYCYPVEQNEERNS